MARAYWLQGLPDTAAAAAPSRVALTESGRAAGSVGVYPPAHARHSTARRGILEDPLELVVVVV